mmetsp:Transcript_13342/g.33568  ORF Transcript_13342/g.33568 Transcript_13342/m.33568 type:complete len:295 (-) Transcript_13342:32-916(-)
MLNQLDHKPRLQPYWNDSIVSSTMSHPAEQINQSNWKIANMEYDDAIESLTHTLKALKLYLSGDCHTKVAISAGLYHGEDINRSDKCTVSSMSSTDGFDYDFFSLPNTSSFLSFSDSACIDSIFEYRDDDNNATCSDSESPLQLSLFRDPIMVLFRKPLDMQICRELTYVTIYNLALSYHLKSLELEASSTSHKRISHLRKALSLYELSQVLLMEKSVTIRVNAVHSMALVSNLRHIHHGLGNSEKVDMCSEHLLATMMYILFCGEAEVLGNSIEEFFDLILPLISKPTTASAA